MINLSLHNTTLPHTISMVAVLDRYGLQRTINFIGALPEEYTHLWLKYAAWVANQVSRFGHPDIQIGEMLDYIQHLTKDEFIGKDTACIRSLRILVENYKQLHLSHQGALPNKANNVVYYAARAIGYQTHDIMFVLNISAVVGVASEINDLYHELCLLKFREILTTGQMTL